MLAAHVNNGVPCTSTRSRDDESRHNIFHAHPHIKRVDAHVESGGRKLLLHRRVDEEKVADRVEPVEERLA